MQATDPKSNWPEKPLSQQDDYIKDWMGPGASPQKQVNKKGRPLTVPGAGKGDATAGVNRDVGAMNSSMNTESGKKWSQGTGSLDYNP